MHARRIVYPILLAAVLLASCQFLSTEEIAATSAAETEAAASPTPSVTNTPTASKTPTLTKTPTETPTLTDTPTETLTPTLTYTPTSPASPTPTEPPTATDTLVPPTITPCPTDSKITIENRSGSPATITLTGPCIYVLNLNPGKNVFYVTAGYYDYTIYMCNHTFYGSFTFKANGQYYVDC